VALALIVPSDGISKNDFFLLKLSTPLASDKSLKFTGKLLTFVILKDFSAISLTSTFEKLMSPSYGVILTSGLTPIPFKSTETMVDPE
jgi:hypothetical protein